MSLWSRIQRQLGEIAGDLLADETHLELEQARALLATDPGAAVELLDKLVAEHPDHALARALLGSAHLELGDPRAAADQFEQALGHDDSLPEAL
ncbi:MAG: tetratricopeptide repeat protein, partial [Deltaproteobacteria bacterium]|nr:tetratricopeptide repeat protein [Deltaproteobacteria bacterium]